MFVTNEYYNLSSSKGKKWAKILKDMFDKVSKLLLLCVFLNKPSDWLIKAWLLGKIIIITKVSGLF